MSSTRFVETQDKLVNDLPIKNAAPYKDAARLDTGPVSAGTVIFVYAEAHGDPRQSKGQVECAWVTGVSVYDDAGKTLAHPARNRGRDLLYAKKHDDTRVGTFMVSQDYTNLQVRYRMRAVNKKAGGELRLSWVKLGVILF